MIRALCIMAALLLIAGCSGINNVNEQPGQATVSSSTKPSESPRPTNEPDDIHATTAEDAAEAVIVALKLTDLAAFSAYIHPDKGILFSPYANIDTSSAQVFQAADLPSLDETANYMWGNYDGSGEPINLTFADYYKKFVYDQDFADAESVSVNNLIGQGNTLVNIQEIFPGSTTVEYHFSGFDPQFDGMDWESLILVLEEVDGYWYTSAIVHSQWTI
ncbi:MAG: hypothetical protein ACE3L7_18120 [Candidatus Pristimantibacillus sp.]